MTQVSSTNQRLVTLCLHGPAASARIGQDRRESLNPAVQGHVVDLDTALGEQLLEIPIRQAMPQVPPHGYQDDLGWEPESGERRAELGERLGGIGDASSRQPRPVGVQARTNGRHGEVALNATVLRDLYGHVSPGLQSQ